jgi:long-chain acyl-CoA synthetase
VESDPVAIDPAAIDRRPRSLVHMFLERADDTPDEDAYYYPVEGGWQESTWAQTRELVEGLAAGLMGLGLEVEDRVALLCSSRYEWVLTFLAAQVAGAAVVPVDPTASDEQVVRVLVDSGAKVVVAEDYDAVRQLWRVRSRIRDVTKVVQVDGDYPDPRVLTLEGLLGLGQEHLAEAPRAVPQRLYAIRRHGLAVLAHPAYDEGPAHAVRLSHGSLTYQAAALSALGLLDDSDLLACAVPLSGTAGRASLAAQLATGCPLALVPAPPGRGAEPDAEARTEALTEALWVVRPTVLVASPEQLEGLRGRLQREQRSGLLRRRTTERAFDTARQVREQQAEGGRVPAGLARRHRSLDKKVLSEVRGVFGGRLRFVVTGDLRADSVDFFDLAEVVVLESYGGPEAGGVVALALPDDRGSRTVGHPLPGTRVRIAADGEILVAGPGLMDGYHGRRVPRVVEGEWLHTGDAGVLDADGRLRVLGRHTSESP